MALGTLEGGALLVGLEIGVDELNEAIDVFDSNLRMSVSTKQPYQSSLNQVPAYHLISLVKVVHVTIENLNEELNRDRGIHASIGDSQGSL